MPLSLHQTQAALKDILRANLVGNVIGSPGIGKSDMIRQVAAEFNLKVIDFRLAQADPTDLSGFPTLNEDRSRCHYAPPITFPLSTDKVPKGYSGWLLFLDELTSAPQMVQAAAYKLILDRQVGEHDLHPNVRIISAGNKVTDKAVVNRMSTALQSRVITLETEIVNEEWHEWAGENNIDPRIIAYTQWKPTQLYNFNPNHQDVTYPCPRTWAFADKLLKIWSSVSLDNLAVLSGTIGKGTAAEFISFCGIYQSLPTVHELKTNPNGVNLDIARKDILFAICSILAHEYNADCGQAFITIIERLPIEFRVIACQNILSKNPKLQDEPNLKAWIAANASELY